MNILLKKKKIQFYEGIWRKSIDNKSYDIINKIFPYPKKSSNLPKKFNNFMYKLKKIENILVKQKKYVKYNKKKKCYFTNLNNIGDKLFNLYNINWDNTLLYYMKNFNVRPSNDFFNFIKNIKIINNNFTLNSNYKYPYFKFKGVIYQKYKNNYLTIKKNQLRILDSLYEDGSRRIYSYKNKLKYSEHSGLLDIGKNKIEKIIINAKDNFIDKYDDEIFFPENIIDEADYEFIFHTHPKTKNRIKDNIVYEFPSFSDLLNFKDNYNEGKTQGSIIIAPEGVYIIMSIDKNYKIKIPQKQHSNIESELLNINLEAYYQYHKNYSEKLFYSKIIKNKKYINKFNKLIEKFNLIVYYFPRVKEKNNYILPDIKLKFNIIETKKILKN